MTVEEEVDACPVIRISVSYGKDRVHNDVWIRESARKTIEHLAMSLRHAIRDLGEDVAKIRSNEFNVWITDIAHDVTGQAALWTEIHDVIEHAKGGLSEDVEFCIENRFLKIKLSDPEKPITAPLSLYKDIMEGCPA